jgi:AraC-like DNA-binding protein
MKDASDKRAALAENVRNLIIQMINDSMELPAVNYSEYISRRLCVNYTLLSKSFSRTIGITIEHYIIIQKIERVKKMIAQTELTLSEIAWKLRYSSPAHLSAQFKRITGIPPSLFRKMKDKDHRQ